MELDIRWWHLIRLRGEGLDIPFSIKKKKHGFIAKLT
jgi:hypothetical protein